MQNINSILREKARTSVFVAHRLRTIYDSDRIIVLRNGQVVESGNHAQLLQHEGLYAELWNGEHKLWMDRQARLANVVLAQENLMVDGGQAQYRDENS